ncbi:hypothetical protein [Bradyrhizobium sp. CCGB20]|uniref:hypothetical protein n=1 Tax=Bradyrhizobium sp. CCGB20 TaxID=2949633 RepID=UPI0020B24D70|nr:hypothetical protein [Bradyrhizobium sp. CCGB20]MCP3400401.1 hypothetical protein [Bradyrhizobium sp. CCGB20]
MTAYVVVKETSVNVFEEIAEGASFLFNDVLHPWQITELWSDEELELINVYRVPCAVVPADKLVTGSTFIRDANGDVQQVLNLVDAPPAPVTPRQIRLALTQMGLRQAVEDYVKTQDISVQDSWNYATEFLRDNELIVACAGALGKTDGDLDVLFGLARTL